MMWGMRVDRDVSCHRSRRVCRERCRRSPVRTAQLPRRNRASSLDANRRACRSLSVTRESGGRPLTRRDPGLGSRARWHHDRLHRLVLSPPSARAEEEWELRRDDDLAASTPGRPALAVSDRGLSDFAGRKPELRHSGEIEEDIGRSILGQNEAGGPKSRLKILTGHNAGHADIDSIITRHQIPHGPTECRSQARRLSSSCGRVRRRLAVRKASRSSA